MGGGFLFLGLIFGGEDGLPNQIVF